MNTKERYMLEALRLFSEKGYGSVGVTEIASAVGCTTSALYKHFPNKKALFDAIVEKSKTDFKEQMLNIHGIRNEEKSFHIYASHMNIAKQVEMMDNLFCLLTEEHAPKYFRRLVRMELSDHPELCDIYMEGYINQLQEYFTAIMEVWMEEGRISKQDPEVLALEYVSPLFSMVEFCDLKPEMKEHCRQLLKKHIETFDKLMD